MRGLRPAIPGLAILFLYRRTRDLELGRADRADGNAEDAIQTIDLAYRLIDVPG